MTFGLYIHVPFCLKRCGYCDFNTYTSMDMGEGASVDHYATMIIEEMALLKRWQERNGITPEPISTIFFGGGTPTVLKAFDLVRMVQTAEHEWGIIDNPEITTEANPDTVDAAYLQTLKAGGFTRISFGMQSAVPHVLKTLDRTHTPENVVTNVKAAQILGLECSVDLIYGTPGESIDDWKTSVRSALAMEPTHISAYALTLEPTTPMGRKVDYGILPKPNDDDEAEKYEIADSLFSAQGLEWYEISNWAVPGHECRHNLGYWRNIDWAGLGPGAHSHFSHLNASTTLPQGAYAVDDHDGFTRQHRRLPEDCSSIRAWDIRHPRRWAHTIHQGNVPWQGAETLNHHATLEEAIMLGVRLREGLDVAGINAIAGKPLQPGILHALHAEGLIERQTSTIVPTLHGRLLNDIIVDKLLDAYMLE
ncbi:radical SAM family heme chaperone HemW [Bifidobacterium aquikefiri]|uniref:radical SAM family heme chaperone HemW n=1 Tax=Bifidobacterium aquikefiri TaxID=1653207 RepID=UPI0039EB2A50